MAIVWVRARREFPGVSNDWQAITRYSNPADCGHDDDSMCSLCLEDWDEFFFIRTL